MTIREQNLSALFELYLGHEQARGKADRALEVRREQVTPFIQWCRLRGVEYAPQVSLALLESYQRWLRAYRKADGQPLAVNGQLSRLSSLRSLFRWLLQHHYILYNPAEQIVLPKESVRLPLEVLTEEETLALLDAQPHDTVIGLRSRAILETFWSSGIRRQELRNLLVGDINFSRGSLVVRQGKGSKDRVVPIGDRALSWIRRYQNEARPQLAKRRDSGHLFLTIHGNRISNQMLTYTVGQGIRQHARLDKAGACHLLRHSVATQMLENGADTRYLQAMLGHSKLSTTQLYTRVAIAPLKAEHERTHPGSRVRKREKGQLPPESESDH